MEYARDNRIKRGPLCSIDAADVVGIINVLKSLGPNDLLAGAVSELDLLLNMEIATLVTQTNKRTATTYRKQILEWLSAGDQIQTHLSKRRERLGDTGGWFL